MKKFLSVIIALAMVVSLFGGVVAPKASAVTGLRTADTYTGVATYTMGETITGTTVGTGVTSVTLLTSALAVVDTYTFAAPAAAGTPFVLRTSSAALEGTYIVRENGGVPGIDVNIYIKYNISNVIPTAAPAISATNALFAGRLFLGDTAGTNVLNATVVTLGYSATGAAGTFAAVATGTTLNGFYNFYLGTVANYGTYAIFVTDAYAPDGLAATAAIYASWVVTPGALTVTPVINPELIYAGVLAAQPVNLYVTAGGTAITDPAATIVSVSGVNPLGLTALPLTAGFGVLTLPASLAPGITNYKVTTATSTGVFTLTVLPLGDWNPSLYLTIPATGFAIGNTVVANYTRFANVLSPWHVELVSDAEGLVGPLDLAADLQSGVIQTGGEIDYIAKELLWNTTNPLTTKTMEKNQKFVISPKVAGDIVTYTPTSIPVTTTGDITVTVKLANGIERNNGKVVLTGSVAGMFTAPTGSLYTVDATGTIATMDATGVNLNIVGGNYVFTGLKYNYKGTITIAVYGQDGVTLTSLFVAAITVAPKVVTLTSDPARFTLGVSYPTVKVSGAVTGLAFTPAAVIDNGDGSYVFTFASPIAAKQPITAYSADGNTEYTVTIPADLPTITITSVHKDGLITDSWPEDVTFTLADPNNNGAALAFVTPQLYVEYTQWDADNAAQDNLPVSSLAAALLPVNTTAAVASTGNKYLDPAVDLPFVGIQATVNGILVQYPDLIKVADPTIKFSVQGMGDTIQLYYNVANTFTVLVKDAHGQPQAGTTVTGLNPYNASFAYLFGGLTGADGSATFSYVPNYMGQIDVVALTATQTVQIVAAPVDTTAPVITVDAGIDGAKVTSDVLTLSGKISEKVSALYVGVNKIDVLPDGTFATTVKLAAGENTIAITAYDLAGNKGAASVKVTYTPASSTSTVIVLTVGTDVVTVDGKATSIEAAPEIINSRTFVPIRFISETFGATVEWLPETQGITITLGDSTIGLQIGNATAVIDGNIVSLPAAPYIKNGRTMVPLRVISDAFGGDVAWDPATRTITITYQP
jgi:hypothetical protein